MANLPDEANQTPWVATNSDYVPLRSYRIRNMLGFDIYVLYPNGTYDLIPDRYVAGKERRLYIGEREYDSNNPDYKAAKWDMNTIPVDEFLEHKHCVYKGLFFMLPEYLEEAKNTRYNPDYVSKDMNGRPMLKVCCNIHDSTTKRIYVAVNDVLYPVVCSHNLDLPENLTFNYQSEVGYRTLSLAEHPEVKFNMSSYAELQEFEVDFDYGTVKVRLCKDPEQVANAIEKEKNEIKEKLAQLENLEKKVSSQEKIISQVNTELAITKSELDAAISPERQCAAQQELQVKKEITGLNLAMTQQKAITADQENRYAVNKASMDATTSNFKAAAVVVPIVAGAAVAAYKATTSSSSIVGSVVSNTIKSVATAALPSNFVVGKIITSSSVLIGGSLASVVGSLGLAAAGGYALFKGFSCIRNAVSSIVEGAASFIGKVWSYLFD